MLEGARDVTVVTRTESQCDFNTQEMTVDELVAYRHVIIKNLEEVQLDLHLLEKDEVICKEHIYELERNVGKTQSERNRYAEGILKMQGILDDGTSLIMRDKNDLDYELKRNRLMLAGKVLSRSIEKGLWRYKKGMLGEFIRNMNDNNNQINSILSFRRICLEYNRKRQHKYFNVWQRNALKPMALVRRNKELTGF